MRNSSKIFSQKLPEKSASFDIGRTLFSQDEFEQVGTALDENTTDAVIYHFDMEPGFFGGKFERAHHLLLCASLHEFTHHRIVFAIVDEMGEDPFSRMEIVRIVLAFLEPGFGRFL